MNAKRILTILAGCLAAVVLSAQQSSTAGFYELPGSGREVYNFNTGWRFLQGDADGAAGTAFDDASWEVVNLPHTVSLIAAEGSGCRNYQGPAWYRKHVTFGPEFAGKRLFLHFEAIMGRSEVYVDGRLACRHTGGYLPVILDLDAAGVKPGQTVVIAVRADNSDDGSYPPGKPEDVLDFTYHGGIYRDCWLVSTGEVYISDPNFVDKQAGGGIFVHAEDVSARQATVVVETDLQNDGARARTVSLSTRLVLEGGEVQKAVTRVSIPAGGSRKVTQRMVVKAPALWTPQTPTLYSVVSAVTEGGRVVDGLETRTGIRSIEFRGKEGFYLNGEPYQGKLMGVNRHQDYAYIGNAMPNNLTWRDAVLLRNAGCTIIRSAHYPQDPSFMDACDALGMFVIVATPGWQFWNDDPAFAEHVYDDIRQMVRRDRNHPSVLMWEPILNETHYPADFAENTYRTTHAEYPYPGCFCAADAGSQGVAGLYDVLYGMPAGMQRPGQQARPGRPQQEILQSTFTREWGDYVDNWEHHNSLSRASRSWGEGPMLIQAMHYANAHDSNDYDILSGAPAQHVGGCLWHSFDHQRGYHPDPFWGGIMDAFRQPKYSYYMFMAQQPASFRPSSPLLTAGPMVYIAHEFGPFSGPDVTVFTNCDAVRLTLYDGTVLYQEVDREHNAMPSAPVVFKDAYSFHNLRRVNRDGTVTVKAEGLIGSEVVATYTTKPSARSYHISLRMDDAGIPFVANGSDIVTVIASITDAQGEVRDLAKEVIVFEVEGEGEIVGDERIQANPRQVEFGTAPVLIRATDKAGPITVRARVQFGGELAPTPAEITFSSLPSADRFLRDEVRTGRVQSPLLPYVWYTSQKSIEDHKAELEQVKKDQELFGEF
ncbi:MAG: glycoside hydrolase family 2 [Bacteroidales bacterium]|nr:glycoside hydrolase family 2 [Bacteroidales bacterium]